MLTPPRLLHQDMLAQARMQVRHIAGNGREIILAFGDSLTNGFQVPPCGYGGDLRLGENFGRFRTFLAVFAVLGRFRMFLVVFVRFSLSSDVFAETVNCRKCVELPL